LELVVVLTILVAIAGILVPLLPNFLHRANVASCVTNISELDKLIQTQQNLNAAYPDHMDNLVIGSGLATYALTGATGEFKQASYTAGSLTTDEAAALTNAGITSVANLVENAGGDWRPTAWPYSSGETTQPTFTPVDSSLKVATLTPFGAQLLGLPNATNYKYVIFGLNKPCTLFRNLATEAPYHFADTPTEDPATYYMCFGAVFIVTRDVSGSPQTLENAKFMGSFAFHDFGLATADSHTKEWWDQNKNDR